MRQTYSQFNSSRHTYALGFPKRFRQRDGARNFRMAQPARCQPLESSCASLCPVLHDNVNTHSDVKSGSRGVQIRLGKDQSMSNPSPQDIFRTNEHTIIIPVDGFQLMRRCLLWILRSPSGKLTCAGGLLYYLTATSRDSLQSLRRSYS